jgi:hypothetical protein
MAVTKAPRRSSHKVSGSPGRPAAGLPPNAESVPVASHAQKQLEAFRSAFWSVPNRCMERWRSRLLPARDRHFAGIRQLVIAAR